MNPSFDELIAEARKLIVKASDAHVALDSHTQKLALLKQEIQTAEAARNEAFNKASNLVFEQAMLLPYDHLQNLVEDICKRMSWKVSF